jgi:hypothetical protein
MQRIAAAVSAFGIARTRNGESGTQDAVVSKDAFEIM